jgi:hypothetical protein
MDRRRLLKSIGVAIGVLVVAVIGFAIWFLFLFADFTDTEVARFPNSSGSLDAVLVERSGNATVPMISMVYVVACGGRPSDGPHFSADRVNGLVVSWIGDQTLQIRADSAHVVSRPKNLAVDSKADKTVQMKCCRTVSMSRTLKVLLSAMLVVVALVVAAFVHFWVWDVVVVNKSDRTLSGIKVELARKLLWEGSLAAGRSKRIFGIADRDGSAIASYELVSSL